MPVYKAPVDDAVFLLVDVLNFDEFSQLPGFGDITREMLAQILGEAAKFAEEVVRPLNQIGDKEGCVRHDDASVTTAKGFKRRLPRLGRGRLDRVGGAARIWRARAPVHAERLDQ